jgi:hypothetical protein
MTTKVGFCWSPSLLKLQKPWPIFFDQFLSTNFYRPIFIDQFLSTNFYRPIFIDQFYRPIFIDILIAIHTTLVSMYMTSANAFEKRNQNGVWFERSFLSGPRCSSAGQHKTNVGLMLWQQFSAIFANFRRKKLAFFSKTNVIHNQIFAKNRCRLNKKTPKFLAKIFQKS